MEIVEVKIENIKPYEKNPRINEDAIKYVAESIENFGFKNPILLDENNTIINGHTRFKACKKLNKKTIPCIYVKDLTDKEIKAFRIADNKVSEYSEWDFDLLAKELEELNNFDLECFDFDIEPITLLPEEQKEETEEEKTNHRDMTIEGYNLDFYDEQNVQGKYQMPIIKAVDYIPTDIISFNYMLTSNEEEKGIHCFVDDYQFERLWNSPLKYLEKIREYDCFFSPDFSLYNDMPIAMKIWNIYRSRLIGQLYQDAGVKVIPTISWSEKATYEFCFDGIEQDGTVAISTIGVKKNKDNYKIWKNGVNEMIKRLKPKNILVYGGKTDYDFKDINVVYYENQNTEKMNKIKGGKNGNK